MRLAKLSAATALLLASATALADQPPREVNITQGSEPGWIPSEELEAEAIATWTAYHRELAEGDYEAAYGMLGEGLRAKWRFAEFESTHTTAKREMGPLIERNLTTITWTKDAPNTPKKGTYVAVDATARFENADRHCGYTILFRAPDANHFDVVRIESSFMRTDEYRDSLQADLAWHLVSRACPNYTPPPLPASINRVPEFESVSKARAAVDSTDGTQSKIENGWTIIADPSSRTVWSFAPEGSPFYPSLVKRKAIAVDENSSRMEMTMLCEVEKQLCDALYVEMAAINGLITIAN